MPATVFLTCGFCEKTFSKLLKHVTADAKRGKTIHYCGLKCSKRKEWNWIKCNKCHKKFAIRPSHKKSKSGFYYCSRSCSAGANNTIYKTKENHPNWIDGRGSYRSVGLSENCHDCGETRYYLLVVHHINKNRAQNEEDNLVTLCLNCHGMRHLIVRDGKLCVHWGTLTTDEAKTMLARGVQHYLSF